MSSVVEPFLELYDIVVSFLGMMILTLRCSVANTIDFGVFAEQNYLLHFIYSTPLLTKIMSFLL